MFLVLVLLLEWFPVPHQFPGASLIVFSCCLLNVTLPKDREQAVHWIFKPASNEMISDSVELWDTDVCFLHIQINNGKDVRLPEIHKLSLSEVDSESSRSPAKSESWNKPQSTMLIRATNNDNIAGSRFCDNVWNPSCQSSVASLSPFWYCYCKFVDKTN